SPSLDGGLPLLWLSLARRASNSCTRSTSAVTCSRNTGSSLTCSRSAAFSASNWAIRASGVMPLGYTCCASLPDLLRESLTGSRQRVQGEPKRRIRQDSNVKRSWCTRLWLDLYIEPLTVLDELVRILVNCGAFHTRSRGTVVEPRHATT